MMKIIEVETPNTIDLYDPDIIDLEQRMEQILEICCLSV